MSGRGQTQWGPARFARGVPSASTGLDQARRSMIAKVHLAKTQLGLCEDDYRAILLEAGGHDSSAKMSLAELDSVLKRFAERGFTAKAKAGARPADHPTAKKARALWISLYQLCAIDDPSERALEAFARRQLGCARLQWADQALTYKLIEALKAIGVRHGWNASMDGVKPEAQSVVLKRRLLDAIVAKLVAADIVPRDWSDERVAWELTGERIGSVMTATDGELERAAAALGAKLRVATR